MDIYTYLYTIFEGYKQGKKLKKCYIRPKERELLFYRTLRYDVYDRKFILFLSLFVIYKYYPQSFKTFLDKMSENLENRNEYFKFKKLLKHPYDFIKQDLEYVIENHFEISETKLLELYRNNKISMYTFYMLLKDKNIESMLVKEILKSIKYILLFLKVKLDKKWFNNVKIESKDLF